MTGVPAEFILQCQGKKISRESEMSTLMFPTPQPGQLFRVHQRQYLVEDTIPPAPGDATLLRLSCVCGR